MNVSETTNPKKILRKPKIIKMFRLFDFQTYDKVKIEEESSSSSEQGSGSDTDVVRKRASPLEKQFVIQMFGVNEKGETCCIYVNNFYPFFYIKVGDNWGNQEVDALIREIQSKLGKQCKNSIVSYELVSKHKLYGFSGGKQHKFLKIVFQNMLAMNKAQRLWYVYPKNPEENGGEYRKRVKFYFLNVSLELYESNIPPLLRYFHIQNISPSGWVSFSTSRVIRITEKTTTCTYEYLCPLSELKPVPEKETRVPYKICSFDIEASSSHGDFPVPVKTYKKLAKNLVDLFLLHQPGKNTEMSRVLFEKIMMTAFGYGKFDDVDILYPKDQPTQHEVQDWIKKLSKYSIVDVKKEVVADNSKSHLLTIDGMFDALHKTSGENLSGKGYVEEEDGGDDEDGEEDGGDREIEVDRVSYSVAPVKDVNASFSLLDILVSTEHAPDEKIQILNDILTRYLPELEGDKVTMIGTTFLRYGEQSPYMNHCIVLGSCDEIPGAKIESVESETDLLLKWTELIQTENPDIIIGYNIFGFDYEFLFRRAQENHCERDFLLLSRKQNELCATEHLREISPNDLSIMNTKVSLASGEYDLRYIQMSGRLQIDLLAYFRRNENLSSYKLDDVAGYFISDDIKNIVLSHHDKLGEVTELYTQNIMGLNVGDFIHIAITTFTTDYYMDGKKFRVLEIQKGKEIQEVVKGKEITNSYNVIVIEGHHTIDQTKSVRWGMAKDDIHYKDIFRLSNGSSSDRALVAKYCIQDCNLVQHLMNKVDVMTGFIEMSTICSVPISFLVFRGQGIKLTSFVAKKCSEYNTLMPDLEKQRGQDGYEGAIVLPPKCAIYMDNPVACVDYSSLYPSSMISQNFSQDSKVWTKEYDLAGKLIRETGERDRAGVYIYDNLPDYHYIDIEFDTFRYIRNPARPKSKAVKTKVGKMVVRWAQLPENKKSIMPSILMELLKARSDTRKKIKSESDPFMQNVLDKRQLGYKVTANSLYGQCGSATSTFYDKDVAACTTATGRMMITYAKRMIEEVYGDFVYETALGKPVKCKAEYVYGDSVASYTPVYVRVGGDLDICSIETLAIKYGEGRWVPCLEKGKQEKEVCELEGVESWTEKGWTKLFRVIRHQLADHKKMIRVLTHSGMVDVTDDHSLILQNGAEVSPKNVVVGTELLHHNLPLAPNNTSSISPNMARIMGFFFGDGSCGSYECPSGKKHSWALNNQSMERITKYLNLCKEVYPEYEWVYRNTLQSSGVYKISPRCKTYGGIAKFVNVYREKLYSKKEKIIPNEIMSGSLEIRQAFWEGLYDADGDKNAGACMRIDQKNQISAAQICWLAASLGWKTAVNTRTDKLNIYRINLTKNAQRKNANAVKKLYEIPYSGYVYDLTTENHHFAAGVGNMIVHNTDSVFFTFNLENPETGEKIRGKPALEMTIEIAQDAAKLCTHYLKPPMELSYEKTLMPFILLSKKRYVGMLYETDPNKGKLKYMGLPLKRRDNCDYLKDVYGGILNILMKEGDMEKAISFLNQCLRELIDGQVPIDKLTITKQLRSYYANPQQIGHFVLADRIGKRDAGNKPKSGDRVKFAFIVNDTPKALMGEKIETPEFILENKIPLDYTHYITNQLMKPLQQLLGLALENIWKIKGKTLAIKRHREDVQKLWEEEEDVEKFMKKREKLCSKKVEELLFRDILNSIYNQKHGIQKITSFFGQR
jgi:DNA polymerase elongation subunit (family B)